MENIQVTILPHHENGFKASHIWLDRDHPARAKLTNDNGPSWVHCPLRGLKKEHWDKEVFVDGKWKPATLTRWTVKTVVVTLTLEVNSGAVADDIVNSVAAPDSDFIANIHAFFNEGYSENVVNITAVDSEML
jgi:hypothetical protein